MITMRALVGTACACTPSPGKAAAAPPAAASARKARFDNLNSWPIRPSFSRSARAHTYGRGHLIDIDMHQHAERKKTSGGVGLFLDPTQVRH
jgi:hypothetical protein